jgi:hypothetical protein
MAADDSALLHAGRYYDPAKAREYYLRTRHLKGRRRAAAQPSSGPRTPAKKGPDSDLRPSRHKELLAEKAKLERRLEELKDALELLVEAAKKRAGVKKEQPEEKSDPKETAAKNEKSKRDQPLSESQKRKKREAAKEQYEKEKKTSLSTEVTNLRAAVQDVRAKLEAAIADAQRKSGQSADKKPRAESTPNPKTASNGR